MSAGAQAVPGQQGPPPGVSLGPPLPQAPPGVTLGAPLPAPPPPPAAPPVAAIAAPATSPSLWQSVKDSFMSDPMVRTAIGFGKGALQTVGGATTGGDHSGSEPIDIIMYKRAHPQASDDEINGALAAGYRAPQHIKDNASLETAAAWFRKHSDTHGFFEGLGDVGENIAELLGTEGLGELSGGVEGAGASSKIATFADTIKDAPRIAEFLEKRPKLAKLLALGVHTAHSAATAAAQSAAQTYVKTGGDTQATATAAELGAAGTAVLEPAIAAAGALVRHLAPKVESIAGREVPVLRSQIVEQGANGEPVGPSTLQTIAATRDNSPAVAGAQQAAAKAGITDSAQDVVQRELQATNATRTAPTNALPSSTDPYTFRIEGTPTTADTEGSMVADPRKRQVGTRVVEGKGSPTGIPPYDAESFAYGERPPGGKPAGEPLEGSHKEPQFQYLTSSKPGSAAPASDVAHGGGTLLTQDPDVAAAHLRSVESIIQSPEFEHMPPEQQAAFESQRADIQQQLREQRMQAKTQQPFQANFSPVDVKGAVARTETYGDAANELMQPAKELYDHANRVSGGQWQPLKDRIQALQKEYWSAATDAERHAIGNKLSEANQSMRAILENPANGFDSTDVTTAIRNWRSSYLLNDLHNAIEPTFNIDAQVARETGKYRGFDGNMLANRFKNFLTRNPDAANLLGRDTVTNLQNVFDHNRTMASRKRFGGAVNPVAQWVADHHFRVGGILGAPAAAVGYALGGYHGAAGAAAGAETLYAATRMVLHQIATNPKVGKYILYAIDGGARPSSFAPLAGKMVLDSVRKVGVPLAASEAARAGSNQPQQEEPQQ